MSEPEATRIISGFRPTSSLTIGNYLGVVKPSLDLQDKPSNDLYIFVADISGHASNNLRDTGMHGANIIRDCLALGINPEHTTLYLESAIEPQVTQIANRVAPYVNVRKLVSSPDIKEHVRPAAGSRSAASEHAMGASFALLGSPVLMAANIYAQDAPLVVAGEDQLPHTTIAHDIANAFNARFKKQVLVQPTIPATQGIQVTSLNGNGKMSRSASSSALFFTDTPRIARNKIKCAITAPPREWNDTIQGHFTAARHMATDSRQLAQLDELHVAHMRGQRVMNVFKSIWGDIIEEALVNFQERRAAINDDQVDVTLKLGAEKATANAETVLARIKDIMNI